MKRGIWIIAAVCALMMNVACLNGAKKNTPETVTEQFSKAFYTADITHQYQYSTKKSDFAIKQLKKAMKYNPERVKEMQDSKVEIQEVKVLEQTDSTATCVCVAKVNGQPRSDKWELLKEDGEWKVTLVMP